MSTPTPRSKKLVLKSDVIKAKGMTDINELLETQFLEFADDLGDISSFDL